MKRYIVTMGFSLLIFQSSWGDFNFGIRVCNNHWQKNWLITVAPEVGYNNQWFWFSADGTYGSYHPSNGEGNYVLQNRISFIPMIRLPLEPAFLTLGYGFTGSIRREEMRDTTGNFKNSSYTDYNGEFRGCIGLAFRLFSNSKIYVKGGYSYINKNNQYYSLSTGMSFGYPENALEITTTNTQNQTRTQNSQQSHSTSIQRISLIKNSDNMINELNAAIEVALSHAAYQVISWEKIRDAVAQDYFKNNPTLRQGSEIITPSDILGEMSNMEIAFYGSRMLKLDAIIETQMRYIYESYGGDILINTAYIRIIQPETGDIIWATEYQEPESPFAKCKEKLTKEVVQALKKFR